MFVHQDTHRTSPAVSPVDIPAQGPIGQGSSAQIPVAGHSAAAGLSDEAALTSSTAGSSAGYVYQGATTSSASGSRLDAVKQPGHAEGSNQSDGLSSKHVANATSHQTDAAEPWDADEGHFAEMLQGFLVLFWLVKTALELQIL